MAVANQGRRAVSRLLCYAPRLGTIRASAIQLRKYSEFENGTKVELSFLQEDSSTVWPDDLMGPLGPKDKRFPLPGNVGITSSSSKIKAKPFDTEEFLDAVSRCDRQLTVVSQLISETDYLDESSETMSEAEDFSEKIVRKYFDGATVELAIQDCPKVLYKDFASMFLEMPKKEVTVITITQKTKNNMSMWNENVETEREATLENFISTATEICHLLRANNFWCDFIDPSSGQPFFSQYTNHTLFETDDRYNSLGFSIEDLGCCRVITHKKWGANVFVGSVVTTASKQQPIMERLLENSTPVHPT